MHLNIVLASVEADLAEAWERFCGDLDGVSVHHGSIRHQLLYGDRFRDLQR